MIVATTGRGTGRSNRKRTARGVPLLIAGAVWLASALWSVPQAAAPQGAPPAQAAADHGAVLKQYCMTCHNQRAKTANLELDTKDLDHLDKDLVAWEAVVRKLRTGMMPPKNAPRPEPAIINRTASWLETGLDRAATLHPNPGSPSLQPFWFGNTAS